MENNGSRLPASRLHPVVTPTPVDWAGLLEGPVLRALLEATGCHVLLLDLELNLVHCDAGAAEALGLGTGPSGLDILPALTHTHFGSRGYRLCGAPVPLGDRGHNLWIFKDVSSQERREELEMIFLHELLATLAVRETGTLVPGQRLQRLWDLTLELYREVVVPGLLKEVRREAPGSRVLEERPGPEEAAPETAPAREDQALVLVVDDSPMVRKLLTKVLAREFRVLTAEDGQQAVALAQEHLPDLILLDALMPVMDGFAACLHLKADPRTHEIPVLFLTALQGEVDEVRALEAGAIDFIQKPVNAASVLARVRNHVELKQSKEKLVELAVRDGLTALANRRHFDQVLAREWQRARREGAPISLLLGDVDSFKHYNDTYGHMEGDECLKAVARVFQQSLRRPTDLAARLGGEEFVCLLPDTDAAGAQVVASAITAGLAELRMPHPHSEVGPFVTVSLGLATAHPALNDAPILLLDEADRRMYEAKRLAKARNRQAGA